MADQGLYQTQTQKLVIGPQMQQSLQILQAPALELRQIIQQEINVNPVLEIESPDVSLEDTQKEDPDDIDLDTITQMDEEWREYWAQSRATVNRRQDDDDRWKYLMDSIVAPTTLQEHLVMQLRTSEIDDPKIIDTVEFLIGNLDDSGFLNSTLDELSLSNSIPIKELQIAKNLLCSFDPVGIGAQDLRECLMIQMERLGKKNSLPYKIVDSHLDDLANKRFPLLAKVLGVPLDQISRAADFVSTLDPKPARRFAPSHNSYITPDIIVEKQGGEWLPLMNNDELPHLRLSSAYKDMLSQPDSSGEVRNYIREKLRSGLFFGSPLMRSARAFFTLVLLKSSPLSVFTPWVKKKRSSNTPCGVAMYFPAMARLTVVSCTSTSLATCAMFSGRRWEVPLSRNSRWCFNISTAMR